MNICLCLLSNSSPYMRDWAVEELGKFRDPQTVEPLISVMNNDSSLIARLSAIDALGLIGDIRAVTPLINILNNTTDSWVLADAAVALGLLGDIRAIEPLIKALGNGSHTNGPNMPAFALALFRDKKVEDVLGVSAEYKHKGAIIALAWRFGEEHLEAAAKVDEGLDEDEDWFLLECFRVAAFARWGNAAAIGIMIADLPVHNGVLDLFRVDVFSRMPKEFPVYDFKTNNATQKKQAKAIKAWYSKHKHRLAWDPEKRKYYLKAETDE